MYVCFYSDGPLSHAIWLVCMLVCVLMAHCHDAMGLVCVFVCVLMAHCHAPWVGMCVCLCSVGSLSRCHGSVCVFVCVLMAICNDAISWSVCLFVF